MLINKLKYSGLVSKAKSNEELDCPTKVDSQFMTEIKKLIPPKDGGETDSINISKEFQEKILDLLGSASRTENEESEKLFEKLRKDPKGRARLENLHAARAFKYGSAHLGQKFWYKDSKNVAAKLKTQSDRRKFRIGLKGDVDFLNQLNIMDLKDELDSGVPDCLKILKMQEPVLPSELFAVLKNAPR